MDQSVISWWSEEAAFIIPFGVHHFIYIFLFVTALITLLKNRSKIQLNPTNLGMILLGISIFQQVLLYLWYIFETGFNISESLPLHICRISTLLGIYFLITKNTKVLDIMFYFGLYAYGSFLYPERVYPIYHVIGISFFINHAITLLLPFFGYIAFGWRPTLKGLFRAYSFFLLYFAFVYVLNPLIDGNYFYLKYRPFFKEWPDIVYIPSLLLFTLIGFFMAYGIVRKKMKTTIYRDHSM